MYAAGDVNGDGFSDAAVSWQNVDVVRIHLGSPTGLTLPHAAQLDLGICDRDEPLTGPLTSGDFDGDGLSDLAISALSTPDESGRTWLVFGTTSPAELAEEIVVESPADTGGGWFGIALGAGDMDGDGLDDLAIGAPEVARDGSGPALYTFLGSPERSPSRFTTLHPPPDFTLEPPNSFARGVASLDADGDGDDDIALMNAQQLRGNPPSLHRASASGLEQDTPLLIQNPDGGVGPFGQRVSSAGDVDGDGDEELLVSNYYVDSVWLLPGQADFVLGEPIRLHAADGPWGTGSPAAADDYHQDSYGYSLASSDVNGDGYSDVVVGAVGGNHYVDRSGAVHLHLGGASGVRAASDVRVRPCHAEESEPDDFGAHIVALGDVDGDGYGDLAVSSAQGIWLLPGRATWPAEVCAEAWVPETPAVCCDGDQQVACPDTADTGSVGPVLVPEESRRCGCIVSSAAPTGLAWVGVFWAVLTARRRA